MTLRLVVSLLLGGLLSSTSLPAEESRHPAVTILWAEGVESPGICVERDSWFVSVVPASLSLDGLTRASLKGASLKGASPKGTGELSEGTVLFLDKAQRLCLIEASTPVKGASPYPLHPEPHPKAGQKFECHLNRSTCITAVTGMDWSYRGERFPMPLIRVRMADPEHFSSPGTPLVNSEGMLVGILTGHELDANGETHAIPVSRIRKLVRDVKRFKRSGPVWVGLVFDNHSTTPEVIEVKSDSPAEEAGLKAGDVILSLNGTEISSLDDLAGIMCSLPAAEEARISVLRGISQEDILVTPRFAEISSR